MIATPAAYGRFRRNWNPNWEPTPPPAFRRRSAPEPERGRWDKAAFAAWNLYCYVHGLDKDDDEMMRKGLRRIVGPFESRKELNREPGMRRWRRATEEIDQLVQRRDGGFHALLFSHCKPIQSDRRLLPAAYALLLGWDAPTELRGAERETWDTLWEPLAAHANSGCPGGDACTLLAECEALLTDARRAAA